MATNSFVSPKTSVRDIVPGDIIVNAQNVADEWGIVERIDPPSSGPMAMIYLTNKRIFKLSGFWTEWQAISRGQYSDFILEPKNKKAHAQHEVSQVNEEFSSKDAMLYRPYEMHLYLLTLHKDIDTKKADYYDYSIVRSIVIAAKNFQMAMDYILSPERHTGDSPIFMPKCYMGEHEDPLKDCRDGWSDPRNIFCQTIGITREYVDPTILSVSREDTNG